MSGKCVKQKNIMVLCRHVGVLLNYSGLLNEVGYFHVILCSNMKEVLSTVDKTKKIDCFIVDGFRIDSTDKQYIRRLNRRCLIKNFMLIGDLAFGDQPRLFTWAKTHCIPLLGISKQPVSASDLKRYLEIL
ncbi:hypothetical protein [Pseudomonas prosekii]|uniref:Glycerol-3-phosphate cytidylyltransferase n=1 Tax=Pseudomonas prosekii TaxID=1148509 RepID=A0A1H2B0A7_9PSED|nr:hypothetical protein [Pseudomonas prosekii]SDT51226.1 hypothetical protein SAMN05216222_4802 [Pseudomonas prosekii]